MKDIGKITIILFTIIITLSLPLYLMLSYDTTIQQQNTKVKQALTTASYDAVKTINLVDGLAFKTQKQKKTALDVFYQSLSASYYSVLGINNTTLNSYLPFVMLIDTDGVYVCYTKNYDLFWGTSITNKPAFTDDMYFYTPLAAYSTSYTLGGGAPVYVVQFTLGDEMTIYKDNKSLVSGNYAHVISLLKDKDPDYAQSMPFLLSEKMYIEEKQIVVTNIISNMINKYLNEDVLGNDNVGFNVINQQYKIILPTASTSVQNAISGPSVLAFYHGPQTRLGTNYVAQVALAGGELAKAYNYYITTDASGNRFYHTEDCPHIHSADGSIISSAIKVHSMEEAAINGAYPDPDCIY